MKRHTFIEQLKKRQEATEASEGASEAEAEGAAWGGRKL